MTSNATGKWKEEQILIICPGSQTTMAQLGCAELTPPAHRFPTRMFWDGENGGWRPVRTFRRQKGSDARGPEDDDEGDDDELEWVEDPESEEGAVYPIQGGRIVHMEAMLALLEHVHGSLTTTYHNTPIVLMVSPQWTRPDCEAIALYVFEKTKTPSMLLVHSGVATQYGLKWPSLTVIDIGFEKVDVTCIFENRVVSHRDVGSYPDAEAPDKVAGAISGGQIFTRRLQEMLAGKNFTYKMAETLKCSPLCEVLPYAPESPSLMELPEDALPTAQGSAEVIADDGESAAVAVEDDEGVLNVADIVASGNTREILAKREKEKQDKAKGKRGKAQEDAPATKLVKLPNSKRSKTVFHYEWQEVVVKSASEHSMKPDDGDSDSDVDELSTPSAQGTNSEENTEGLPAPPADVGVKALARPEEHGSEGPAQDSMAVTAQPDAARPEPTRTVVANEARPAEAPILPSAPAFEIDSATAPTTKATFEPAGPEYATKTMSQDIEIGLERFLFADRAEIDRIVDTIFHAVQGIEDMYMRPACWENLIFVGNGSRVRGLKENIMQTLAARYVVSPSTATMFTSELPSNLGTPSGTGSQTPTSSFVGGPPHPLPTSSNVNPLLQAATTANLNVPGPTTGMATPGSDANGGTVSASAASHHFHSQTPTQIKLALTPSYLSEWTKHGCEEAMFLGAQVAARLAFCVHNLDVATSDAQRFMSFSRMDFNELGPRGIHAHSMLG